VAGEVLKGGRLCVFFAHKQHRHERRKQGDSGSKLQSFETHQAGEAFAGGAVAEQNVWPAAAATLAEHGDWIRGRLRQTVQTNEPGRAAVLFAALLWLSTRYRRPIRLLEIGASAGLKVARTSSDAPS